MDVRAALREGAYALTAHSRVRSELPEDGPRLHVGFRREAFRVEHSSLRALVSQDADNVTVHWALEPIRRQKASTGPRSARPKAGTACTGARECRPKAGTDLHWGTECRPKAGTGARSARPKAGTACTGARECRPKAGTGLHWGHVGVPCCRPKAGAGWAEGPALRRAQCARGAVSSALCTARGSAVCAPYIYYYIYC